MTKGRDESRPVENARRLRKEMTEVEKLLWWKLRRCQLGVRFRRQAPIGPFVADFACHDPKLVVELDGGQHTEPSQEEYDRRRTAWLRSQGFEVMRFWNFQVNQELEAVVTAVHRRVMELRGSEGS